MIIFIIIFSIIPLSSIGLCLMKDINRTRKISFNILLMLNALFFLSPMIYAYLATYPDGNMWSENGPGAVMWFYLIILPSSSIIQILLLILKLKFSRAKK